MKEKQQTLIQMKWRKIQTCFKSGDNYWRTSLAFNGCSINVTRKGNDYYRIPCKCLQIRNFQDFTLIVCLQELGFIIVIIYLQNNNLKNIIKYLQDFKQPTAGHYYLNTVFKLYLTPFLTAAQLESCTRGYTPTPFMLVLKHFV